MGDGTDTLIVKATHVKGTTQLDGGPGTDTFQKVGNIFDAPIVSSNIENTFTA